MPAGVAAGVTQSKINPRFLPAIDRVLVAGLRLGDAGKHEAINRLNVSSGMEARRLLATDPATAQKCGKVRTPTVPSSR